jgi:hypothetical protein
MTRRYRSMWMSHRYPLAYRVLPKCGCSTVGQWFHWLDFGEFFPRLIHDADAPILKWGYEAARPLIADRLDAGDEFIFTFARNPYRRVLSAFSDKICGYQSNGTRYRGGQLHRFLLDYQVNFEPNSDIFRNFRGFLRFVRDTVTNDAPVAPDPHWRPCADHLRISLRLNPKWTLHFVGHLEHLHADLKRIADAAGLEPNRVPQSLPRENTTSLGQIPPAAFFGPEEIELIREIYHDDFRWFGYSVDPSVSAPTRPVDLATILSEGRDGGDLADDDIVKVADQLTTS